MSEKWIKAAFDDVVFDITSKGVKLPQSKYEANGLIPIVDQGQSFIAGYTNETKGVFRDLPAIIFGDHTRALKYADFRFFLGADGTKILKPKVANVDCKYMYFFLGAHPVPNTGYNRHYSWLKRIDVFFPQSLSTQCHIAEVLATCDEVIAKSERAAEKYRQIKAGMLKDLLTRGIDNRGKLRPPPSVAPELYKDSVLGPIPKEWEVKRLGDCGKFVAGNGFPLAYQGGLRGKYPFYKVSDFNRIGNERVMVMANNCINEDVAEMLHCSIIPKDAIVFAKIGAAIALERKRKVSSACCIDNNMMSFQVYNDYEVDFVLNHLQQQKFADLIEATALPALKTSVLKNILLPIPIDLAEQRAIAERLAAVDERIAAEVKTAEKYRKVKAGLMEKLLTPPADAEIEDMTQEVAG